MKEFALMQFQHLPAPVLHPRHESAFPRILAVHDIRPLLPKQCLQPLPMHPPPAKIAHKLAKESLPIVIRIVDPQIHNPNPLRHRIKQISPLLVRSNHQNLPVSMPLQPSYLIHQHPLHPAGIR